jgi:hypothetical protein
MHTFLSTSTERLARAPALLTDATRQQFAREAASIIQCARCPAPHCGRWFLRSASRKDRQYCSSADARLAAVRIWYSLDAAMLPR